MEQNEIYAALPGVLLPWYEKNARDLPWRHTKEPYRVWVSEIMLQQTRVEAVIGYYERFMEAFPTVQALAEADEARVLKLWEGLGYYSRARNLQKTAKLLTETQNGAFPDTAEALEKLPGIGAYTAGYLQQLGVPFLVYFLAAGVLTGIIGAMVESHLVEGRQNIEPGKLLERGKSVTDACLGWDDSVALLEILAQGVRERRLAVAGR